MPIENLVFSNQNAYYDAIALSNSQGECTPFVDFMLQEIASTLRQHLGKTEDVGISERERALISLLRNNGQLSAWQLAEALSCSTRQIERSLASLKKQGVLTREGPNTNGCWKVQAEPPAPTTTRKRYSGKKA